jgi:hypothetical protein
MRTIVEVVYAVALAMQLTGAYFVIRDVRHSIANMGQFKADIAAAEAKAEEHRSVIANSEHNEFIRGLGPQQREVAVQRLGPAGQMKRDAVIAYATAHDNISDLRRWGAVAVLLAGVVLGFVGNVASLYIAAPTAAPRATPLTASYRVLPGPAAVR